MSLSTFNIICLVWAAIAVLTYILLQFVRAPYGRHARKGWGPEIPNRIGWLLMEAPSFLIILYFLLIEDQGTYAVMLSVLWLLHYAYRSFVFPFRIRTSGKKMPVLIVLSAVFFNCVNAGLNGYYLAYLETYTPEEFQSWNFLLGAGLFTTGVLVNQVSDHLLIKLRKPGETGYLIPHGFLFKFISCPNLLGEIVQWTGFALMAWNLPAFTFLLWTLANLLPRAKGHHLWYLERFKDYPKKRKILLPWVW